MHPKSKQPHICASLMDVGLSSDYLHRHTFTTTKPKQITSHPPLLFFLLFLALPLSACSTFPPTSRLVSKCVHSGPPERELMRANDGNACHRFPFINRSTLAQAAFHQQQPGISASTFSTLHPSPPHPISYPSPLSSLRWSGFFSFLYLSCTYPAVLSFAITSFSMSTNVLMWSQLLLRDILVSGQKSFLVKPDSCLDTAVWRSMLKS